MHRQLVVYFYIALTVNTQESAAVFLKFKHTEPSLL
jgi:hypothetical protein